MDFRLDFLYKEGLFSSFHVLFAKKQLVSQLLALDCAVLGWQYPAKRQLALKVGKRVKN
jgi:hypothetical protein